MWKVLMEPAMQMPLPTSYKPSKWPLLAMLLAVVFVGIWISSPGQKAVAEVAAEPSVLLKIYGGASHDIYLGCLNCNVQDTDSTMNPSGRYGFGTGKVSPNIYDVNGPYADKISATSSCNPAAANAPVVRGSNGVVYGNYTVNPSAQFTLTSADDGWPGDDIGFLKDVVCTGKLFTNHR